MWFRRSSRAAKAQRHSGRRLSWPLFPQLRLLRIEPLEVRRLLTVSWVGPATGYWDVGANWSTGNVPAAADDVSIGGGATVTIQSGDSISINSVNTLSGTTLVITGGSLAIATQSSIAGDFNLSGGTLGGAGNVTFDATVNWMGGTMAGTGTSAIAASGTLNVSGQVYLQGVLENDGSADWSGAYSYIFMSDGTINNYGSWAADSNSTLTAEGYPSGVATNVFNNFAGGTFTQQGTGTTQFTAYSAGVAFNDVGTVNVDQGTFAFASDGTTELTLNGTLNVGSATNDSTGAILAFQNTQTIDGAGTIAFGTSPYYAYLGYANLIDISTPDSTVTFGPDLTIQGQSGLFGTQYATPAYVNQGTISADAASISFGIYSRSANAALTWSNTGTLQALDGSALNLDGSFTNSGTISAAGGSVLSIGADGSTWSSSGAISADASTINLGGSWQFANGHDQRHGRGGPELERLLRDAKA